MLPSMRDFFGVALVDAPPHAWLLCCAALDPASSPNFTDPFDLDVADINLEVDAPDEKAQGQGPSSI
jgi:hypothetical protein